MRLVHQSVRHVQQDGLSIQKNPRSVTRASLDNSHQSDRRSALTALQGAQLMRVARLSVHCARRERSLRESPKHHAQLAQQATSSMLLAPRSAKLAAQGHTLILKALQLALCATLELSQMKVE
jgi:hypothetical protein